MALAEETYRVDLTTPLGRKGLWEVAEGEKWFSFGNLDNGWKNDGKSYSWGGIADFRHRERLLKEKKIVSRGKRRRTPSL